MRGKKRLIKIISALLVAGTMSFNCMSVFANPVNVNERENLALGKNVEASSVEVSKWGPDKTTDGITDRGSDITKPGQSRWSSNALNNGQNPQWITIDLGEMKTFNEVVVEWERNNITSYKIEVSNDKETWNSVHEDTKISALRDIIKLQETQKARYIRVYVANNNPNAVVNWDNVSIYEVEVYNNEDIVTPPVEEGNGENIALNKTAIASEIEAAGLTADKVTDGDTESRSSRWSSGSFSNDKKQWIYVDLEKESTFDKIKLFWEGANAKVYQIQTSNDAENWEEIYRKENAPGGVELIEFDTKQSARYVRVYCEKNNPAVWSSVSLFEIEIYNGKLPETIDEVLSRIEVKISEDGTKLLMPEVSAGYEISFIGADYKQVIDNEMNIHQPLVDTKIIVDFELKKGDIKKETSGIEITVPGRYNSEIGTNAKPTVIPELREWAPGIGNIEITDNTKIVVNPENEVALKDTAAIFAENYKDVTDREIEIEVSNNPQNGDFYLTLGSTYSSTGEEGYYISIGDTVEIEGNHPTGVLHATMSILQILKQTENTLPKGLVRDYPRYEIRGFMLDVARKPISMDFLQQLVKNMSWYKMNDFQVHLNDNYIWVSEYGASAIEDAYAGFRLESNDVGENGKKLTSEDLSYSKEEFGNFIDESKKYGVTIVPEFDTPGHALAFTKVHPEYAYGNGEGENAAMLDVNNPEVVEYVKGIFNEYLDGENPVFRDVPVHVGTDEFYGSSEEYRAYTDTILKFMRDDKQRTTRVWGSLTHKKGNTPVTSENIQMNIWNNGWADPSDMYKEGYDLINTEDGKLYIVPAAGYYYDYLNAKNLYETWVPNKFANGDIIPAGSEQMLGGMFALWNDMIDKKANGIVEYDLFDRILPAVQVLSEKMWGTAEDKSFDEFKAVANEVGTAPNTNLRYIVESKSENVLDYKFNEDITSLKDLSGNDYHVLNSENVESVKGQDGNAIKFNGDSSYVQSPIDNIGPNYTITMKVKRAAESGNEEQILFESSKGAFKAVQKETGKVGFTREFYDFSFNYELPLDEWVELTIIGAQNKTQLYVNGNYVDEISKAGTNGKYHGTFVFPLEVIGSKANAFNGEIDELMVKNIKENIADKTIIPQEYMSATATSEQSGSEGPAALAIDGDEGTLWHTKWSGADKLPQSITLALGKEYTINKLSYLPRQSGNNGNITAYDILVSNDGETFTKISEGTWENNSALKKAEFEAVKATHVRLTAKTGVGGFASASEINIHQILEEEPVLTSKVTITSQEEVFENDILDVKLGVAELSEKEKYFAADLTFKYDSEIFEFNEVISNKEDLMVTAEKINDGEIRIVIASLGTPIVNASDLVNVKLKAIAKSDNATVEVSNAEFGDGEGIVTSLGLDSKNIVVKEKGIEEIVVSKISNLKVEETTSNKVKLTWNKPKSTVGLVEYVIYKDGKKLTTVQAKTTEVEIEELRSNTIYGFKVTAKYSNGKESKPVSINVRTKK